VIWIVLGVGVAASVLALRGHVITPSSASAAPPPPPPLPPRTPTADGATAPAARAVTDREALARIIRSESGSHTADEKLAIAWVARNRARKAGKSIAELVCSPECGQQGPGRPMSSRRDPLPQDFALADVVLAAPQSIDPTRGAWRAFEPALQDKLVGKDGRHKLTAAAVRERWLRDSDHYGNVGRWELFGPRRAPAPTAKRPPHRPQGRLV